MHGPAPCCAPAARAARLSHAQQVTAADLGGEPFGLLVLDCHHYPATKQLLKNVLRWRLLRRDGALSRRHRPCPRTRRLHVHDPSMTHAAGMLFLHDTGRHSRLDARHRLPPPSLDSTWRPPRRPCATLQRRVWPDVATGGQCRLPRPLRAGPCIPPSLPLEKFDLFET